MAVIDKDEHLAVVLQHDVLAVGQLQQLVVVHLHHRVHTLDRHRVHVVVEKQPAQLLVRRVCVAGEGHFVARHSHHVIVDGNAFRLELGGARILVRDSRSLVGERSF